VTTYLLLETGVVTRALSALGEADSWALEELREEVAEALDEGRTLTVDDAGAATPGTGE